MDQIWYRPAMIAAEHFDGRFAKRREQIEVIPIYTIVNVLTERD